MILTHRSWETARECLRRIQWLHQVTHSQMAAHGQASAAHSLLFLRLRWELAIPRLDTLLLHSQWSIHLEQEKKQHLSVNLETSQWNHENLAEKRLRLVSIQIKFHLSLCYSRLRLLNSLACTLCRTIDGASIEKNMSKIHVTNVRLCHWSERRQKTNIRKIKYSYESSA